MCMFVTERDGGGGGRLHSMAQKLIACSEGALRVPHPACPIVPSHPRASSVSLARSLSLYGMAQIKCGSLHPVKLPPPPATWVLTWQLSCSEGKKRRVRDSEAAEPQENTKSQRRRTGLQTLTWPLWAAQTDGLSLWKSTGKKRSHTAS